MDSKVTRCEQNLHEMFVHAQKNVRQWSQLDSPMNRQEIRGSETWLMLLMV